MQVAVTDHIPCVFLTSAQAFPPPGKSVPPCPSQPSGLNAKASLPQPDHYPRLCSQREAFAPHSPEKNSYTLFLTVCCLPECLSSWTGNLLVYHVVLSSENSARLVVDLW